MTIVLDEKEHKDWPQNIVILAWNMPIFFLIYDPFSKITTFRIGVLVLSGLAEARDNGTSARHRLQNTSSFVAADSLFLSLFF